MTARKKKARVTYPLMIPSTDLAPIVGAAPKSRSQIAKAIWGYIMRHGLQDQRNRRMINADAQLAKVFGGKRVVSMFEMTAIVESHLRRVDDDKSPGSRVRGKNKAQTSKPGSAHSAAAGVSRPSEASVARFLDKNVELDAKATRTVRREQKMLRRLKFAGETEAQCAICGRALPVELLVAAHIKPRSRCSAAEKKRVDDNVMGVCVLGCDALFERGIVYVQQDGKIQSAAGGALTQSLTEHVSKLVGRVCTAWSPASERFFTWHAGHHEAIRRRKEALRLGT